VGRSPAHLIIEKGEAAFRAIEAAVLRDLLRTDTACVVALGGGAWIEETNRDLIQQYGCLSVWLDVPFEICWARIEASTEERPLGKTREQARALYDRRRPIYQLADIQVSIRDLESLEDVIRRIEQKLGEHL
jgi:shikimate kinase